MPALERENEGGHRRRKDQTGTTREEKRCREGNVRSGVSHLESKGSHESRTIAREIKLFGVTGRSAIKGQKRDRRPQLWKLPKRAASRGWASFNSWNGGGFT